MSITINIDEIVDNKRVIILNLKKTYIHKYIVAFNASISGYCIDIFSLQLRHLPPRIIKLITGIKSYHLMRLPQFVQWDAPNAIDSCRGIL